MASSGSFSGSIVSGHYKLRVDWSQAKNMSANTSVITCRMYLINDWSLDIGSRSNTCTINGTAVTYSSSAISTTGTHSLGTASGTVSHNSDGTKSITIKAVFNIRATISGTYYESITASATVNKPVSSLREENILLKPVTQMALAHVAAMAKRKHFEWSEICNRLNRVNWAFTNELWFNVLIIGSANKKMMTGKDSIRRAGMIISYLVMGSSFNQAELDDVTQIIRNARNDESTELPAMV